MTYDEALAFWYGRTNYEVKAAAPADLKLERMRAFLRHLGDPHRRLRCVHVAGTKGKGSTAAMLAAVLRAAGYRVGLFTSPHLVRVEERVQVDGVPIGPGELAALMADIAPAVRAVEAADGPTFFEIGTAVGLLHFVRRRVDVAVVEVGLGGRFDSTNVITPLVSVVTSVGLDHTAQLGNTVEAIAYQKAGIIKRRVPAVSGVPEPGPRDVIRRVAAELDAPLWERGREFDYTLARDEASGELTPPGEAPQPGGLRPPLATIRTPRGVYPGLRVNLLGEHQAANAAVAVATVERLRDAGLVIPDAAIRTGLERVEWPARVEVVRRRPWVVIDSAHNVPSAEALVATLRQAVPAAGAKACVFAVSSDKPYREMLRVLAGYFDRLHLTRYGNNPRCVPPEALAADLAAVAPGTPAAVHPAAAGAFDAATAAAGADDLVCVTGSVFLAGELRGRATM
jgi:dihydrofolate synthase/folylpolyglutamate synthase